ncbi:hypothetical protein LCGC14_0852460 [marine sediment metagenome]|uniref:Uncharacterized protein n=1 Tax=marine sediment metagenome TaxID=412755 RepID=A0A0F9RUC5_9ZZZZ
MIFENMSIGQLQKLNEECIAQNEHPTAEELLKRYENERRNN